MTGTIAESIPGACCGNLIAKSSWWISTRFCALRKHSCSQSLLRPILLLYGLVIYQPWRYCIFWHPHQLSWELPGLYIHHIPAMTSAVNVVLGIFKKVSHNKHRVLRIFFFNFFYLFSKANSLLRSGSAKTTNLLNHMLFILDIVKAN